MPTHHVLGGLDPTVDAEPVLKELELRQRRHQDEQQQAGDDEPDSHACFLSQAMFRGDVHLEVLSADGARYLLDIEHVQRNRIELHKYTPVVGTDIKYHK